MEFSTNHGRERSILQGKGGNIHGRDEDEPVNLQGEASFVRLWRKERLKRCDPHVFNFRKSGLQLTGLFTDGLSADERDACGLNLYKYEKRKVSVVCVAGGWLCPCPGTDVPF